MLGYKVDFSIIYAIMASQSGETPGDKRVGTFIKLRVFFLIDIHSFLNNRISRMYIIFKK
jgi:hypothetical protein